MKLSVSEYSYSRVKIEGFNHFDMFEHAKKNGYDGVELFPGARWKDYSAMDSAKIFKDKCAEMGLEIFNLPGGLNMLEADMETQVNNGKWTVDYAVACGAPSIRLDTMRGDFGVCGAGGLKAAIARIAEGMRQVADYAAEKGVNVLVENHGQIMQDSMVVEELINTVARNNYGALVDIGNFLCADEDPAVAVGRLAKYAKHVHMKDFHVKNGNEYFVPASGWFGTRSGNYLRGSMLGHGNVPIVQCIRTLLTKGYKGAFSLEFEGMEDPLFAIEEASRVFNNVKRILGR